MKKFAIIVAGGTGKRMGADVPKQFLLLGKKPVLMHTIDVFNRYDKDIRIIVVLPQDQFVKWVDLCSEFNFAVKHQLVMGGESRFQSVKNGLELIDAEGIVFIHDGVRPLVSHATLKRCEDCTVENGNAIPVLPVTESVRMKSGDTTIAVDRSLYMNVQTPQTFKTKLILEAYKKVSHTTFTDDASVLEATEEEIKTVEGNYENIKITRPVDLKIANLLLTDINSKNIE